MGTSLMLAPPPSRVLRQQFSLLGTPTTVGALVVGLMGVQMIVTAGYPDMPTRIRAVPALTAFPLLVVLGALWPAIVWHGEGPSRRLYHWALPTPRVSHDLARVAAGGLWLLIGLAVVATLQAVIGILVGDPEQITKLSLGTWLNYLTGPLTMYLFVSALAVATDYPLRWLLAILFSNLALVSACSMSVACRPTPLMSLLRRFMGIGDTIAPFVGAEYSRHLGPPPGFGGLALIVLGLAAGSLAVYIAALFRSR